LTRLLGTQEPLPPGHANPDDTPINEFEEAERASLSVGAGVMRTLKPTAAQY